MRVKTGFKLEAEKNWMSELGWDKRSRVNKLMACKFRARSKVGSRNVYD